MRQANMMKEVQNAFVRLGLFDYCVTNVVVSPDWKYSNVYCIATEQENDKNLVQILTEKASEITNLVKERCHGHFFPKFRFRVDLEARQKLKLEEIIMNLPVGEDESESLCIESDETI